MNFKKIATLILTVVMICTTFITSTITANAASANNYIIPGQYRLESASKSQVMMNLWGNQSANQTKITTWKKDNSREQIFTFKYEGNGAYRIYFADHPTKCVDVLRYNNPLKSGQKVECYDDNDATAQLIIPYKVNNNTVIFRMKSNKNLAISINKTSNGSQLVLRKFNASDKKQQFVFRSTNSSFKKVNAFTSKEPTNTTSVGKGLKGIPSSSYSVKNTYTISNVKYNYCVTTKAYNGYQKGTTFYIKASNKSVITEKKVLNQLNTIQLMNDIRSTYISTLKSFKKATTKTYECAASWNRNSELTKLLGTSAGAGLRAVYDCSTGNPALGLINCGKTIGTEMAEPETVLSCTSIVLLKALSADTVYYCNQAINQLNKPFTDYNKAVSAARNIANATAYYNATMKLGRPILDGIIQSNPWKTTIGNLGMSLLEGALGDTIGIIEAASIAQNIFSVSDFLETFKVKKTFNDSYNRVTKTLILG